MQFDVFKSKNYRFLSEMFHDQKIDIFDRYIVLKYNNQMYLGSEFDKEDHWILIKKIYEYF